MHLTSFGPGFRAFRCTQPSPNPHDQHTPDARLGQTHVGDVKDAILSGAHDQTVRDHQRVQAEKLILNTAKTCSGIKRRMGDFI
jgi:hypothetical protein